MKSKSQKTKIRKPINLLRFLIESYLLIFAVVVILAVFLVLSYSKVIRYADMRDDHIISKMLDSQEEKLENENYEDVNLSLLGKKGYMEILDENLSPIYSSNGKKHKRTPKEIKCIPDVSSKIRYWVEEVDDSDGEVAFIFYKGIYKNNNLELSQIAVLNNDVKILYTDMEIGGEKLSNKSLGYIINELSDLVTQKYKFKNGKGEIRYAILHCEMKSQKIERNFFIIGIIIIIMIVLFSALVWALWVSKKINTPVKILRKRISMARDKDYIDVNELPRYDGIIELKEVIAAFDRMNNRLRYSEKQRQELEDERRKLTMDISHDLKTPITVIKGYTQALKNNVIDKEEQGKYLTIIDDKVDLLTDLIDQLFSYSTMEHPYFELEMESIDVVEYLREYMASRYDDIVALGYELVIDIPEISFNARIDRLQFRRVFENIINNTIKHNPPGIQIYVSMDIISHSYGDEGRIILGDNGCGIKDELKESIFRPFVVGEKARTSGAGTGLGLSIAKKIIEKHGGSIKLLDEWNSIRGTVYEIKIPEDDFNIYRNM